MAKSKVVQAQGGDSDTPSAASGSGSGRALVRVAGRGNQAYPSVSRNDRAGSLSEECDNRGVAVSLGAMFAATAGVMVNSIAAMKRFK